MMESMYSAETVPRKDMVVQGRDGPRWLRERDDDDDDERKRALTGGRQQVAE